MFGSIVAQHAFVLKEREDGSDDGLADLYLEGTDQHRVGFTHQCYSPAERMDEHPTEGPNTRFHIR